jgi:hypothetical protein
LLLFCVQVAAAACQRHEQAFASPWRALPPMYICTRHDGAAPTQTDFKDILLHYLSETLSLRGTRSVARRVARGTRHAAAAALRTLHAADAATPAAGNALAAVHCITCAHCTHGSNAWRARTRSRPRPRRHQQ